MWHEARKQEKKLRGLMVDYKKRAERRRNYYELCKKDPCSFLRIQGAGMKISIDPAVVSAAEGPRTMMAWNNDQDNMIDRFDVRAHMDFIPDYKNSNNLPDALEVEDDMRCNYDRYRIIVQNDCAKITEETALRQIEVDERFGDITKNQENEERKRASSKNKAAIGFSYEVSDNGSKSASGKSASRSKEDSSDEENAAAVDDFEDVDLDIAFDIDEIGDDVKQQLDVVAITYGMSIGEFAEQLRKDKEDEQELREAKIAEQEKAAMSGRKSRKERRLYKETMLRLRGTSPPKYRAPDSVSRASPTYDRSQSAGRDSDSSRSNSPVPDTLEFITNLGEEGDNKPDSENINTTNNLPPHLQVGANSNAASWKQRRMRSESPPGFLPSRKSRERSPPPVRKQSPPPPVRRYRQQSSNSDSSDSDDDKKKKSSYRQSVSNRLSGEGGSGKDSAYKSNAASKGLSSLSSAYGGANSKLSAQERLKRKMNSALNRTYRQDKRSEDAKRDQARQEQQERAEELRAQADELRRKEFQKRSRQSSSRSRSRSRSRERFDSSRKSNGVSRYDDRDTRRDSSKHVSSRESRDRYRDHRTSGRRSNSRSPTRRRNYR